MNADRAPRLKVLTVDCFESPFRLRLPFRFGAVTMTEGLQAYARVRVRLDDGREGEGFAAEALAAKWFDKDPRLTDDDNHRQLRKAIEIAADAYRAAPPLTAFELFAENYAAHLEACAALGLPPLVASYGPALLDRAVLDAVCRLKSTTFWGAMQANLVGLRAHPIAGDVGDFDFDAFLASRTPQTALHLRHTVGLVDPIVASDQPTRVDDGLPETLEEVAATYGNRYFKIKVGGDLRADIDRLERIASVLDRIDGAIHVTLDGNEQYSDVDAVVALWAAVVESPALRRLAAATLFIEQPIKRQAAFATSVAPLARHLPVLIDESDGDLDAFPRARRLGYTGVSSKSCKGFYKSIINLVRCRRWNEEDASGDCFMSAEDLTTQPGLALQHDLALVGWLGLGHVERNAHHFIDGFAGRPDDEARDFLGAHPDLYRDDRGRVRLRIDDGRIAFATLAATGFSSPVVPRLDETRRMPKADWPPPSEGGGSGGGLADASTESARDG